MWLRKSVCLLLCISLFCCTLFIAERRASAFIPPMLLQFGIYLVQVLMAGAAVGGAAVVGNYAVPAVVDKVSNWLSALPQKAYDNFTALSLLWQAGKTTFGLRELQDVGLGSLGGNVVALVDAPGSDLESYSYSGVTASGDIISFDLPAQGVALWSNYFDSVLAKYVDDVNMVGWEVQHVGSMPCFLGGGYLRSDKPIGNHKYGLASGYKFVVLNRGNGKSFEFFITTFWGRHSSTGSLYQHHWVNLDGTGGYFFLALHGGDQPAEVYDSALWANNWWFRDLANGIGLSYVSSDLAQIDNNMFYGSVNVVSNMSLVAVNTDSIALPGAVTIPSVEAEPPAGVVPVIPDWWDVLNPGAVYDQSVTITNEIPVDVPVDDTIPGFLQGILDFLYGLVDGLINALSSLLQALFIPSADFWSVRWGALVDILDSRIPVVGQLLDMFGNIANVAFNTDPVPPVFEIELNGKWGSGKHKIIDFAWFEFARNTVLWLVRGVAWFWFLKRLLRRIPTVVYR